MVAVKLRTEKVTGVTDLLQVSRPSDPAQKPPSPLKQHAGVPSLTGASRSLPQVAAPSQRRWEPRLLKPTRSKSKLSKRAKRQKQQPQQT